MKQDITPAARAVSDILERLGSKQAEHENVRALIGQAEQEKLKAEDGHKASLRKLEANEAASVLDGTAKDQALRKAVMKHAEEIMVLNARIAGLEDRDQQIKIEIVGLSSDLALTEQRWINEETLKAQAAYAEAVKQFVAASAIPLGAMLALGSRGSLQIMNGVMLPDPENPLRNAFPQSRNFKSHPEIVRAVEVFAEIRESVKAAVSRAKSATGSTERK